PMPKVRNDAVYYGLSNIEKKNRAVVECMLDLWLFDGSRNDRRQRLEWGLRNDGALVREALQERMSAAAKDPFRAILAYGASLELIRPDHRNTAMRSPIEPPVELT